MRRVVAMLGTAVLLLAGGCGLNSYETRLNATLERMKKEARMNKLLMPPSTKGKWEELFVYLRPPKSLAQTKEFLLTAPEPGKFDLEASFLEPQKQSLHVLVRRKLVKNAKKKTATPADTADRTNFNRDILALLNSSYSPPEELTTTQFKPKTEAPNEYKAHSFAVNDKNVQAYLYKKDPYEVALIFEYPKSEHGALISKIQLCLESFAVGERARRFFSGATGEEEGGGAGAPTGVAF